MSASTGSGAGDDRRREATFTWVSTGRRIAAARVGRRWADVRGSLLAAATLALLQAALVYVALRAVQELGLSLFLLVPIVAVTTLGAGHLARPRPARVRRGRAARPGARREDPRDRRGAADAVARRAHRDGGADGRPRHPVAPRLRRGRRHRPLDGARARRPRVRPPRRGHRCTARRRGRDGRPARRPAAGRLGPRLRRPRLPAALGGRRAAGHAVGRRRFRDPVLRGRAERVGPRPRDRAEPVRPAVDRAAGGRARRARERRRQRRAGGTPGADRAPLPLQRAQHHRRVLPHPAGRCPPPRAGVRRLLPLVAAPSRRVRRLRRRARPRRRLPRRSRRPASASPSRSSAASRPRR